ncbi:MAG: ribosome maturation factor RimM [bacterium]|nr:ribosome maturation factor RimM [bacterium]
MSERITVGRIVRPHGLRGEVVVQSLSDAPHRWKTGERFFVSFDKIIPVTKALLASYPVLTLEKYQVRGETAFFTVKFTEVSEREISERLVGAFLEVEERQPLKGKWLFYNDDLTGMSVYDDQSRICGTVVEVQEYPASHLLEVRSESGETALVPFLKKFVKAVDLEQRTITLKLLPGLLPWMDD